MRTAPALSCALLVLLTFGCDAGDAEAPPAAPPTSATSDDDPPPSMTLSPAETSPSDTATGDIPLAGDMDMSAAPSSTSRGGDGGVSDASSPAVPTGAVASPGCGRAGRPADGVVTVDGDHIYTFPPGYDGQTPVPVVFGFHANSNPIDQIRGLTQASPLPNNYVMVFPKSVGSGWSIGTDAPRLDGWYRDLLDNYCVDESRIFATGHSSGAQFIVQLLCRGEQRFKAVAPVASSRYCDSWPAIPTLLVHGSNDMERARTNQDADGRKDLGPYLTSNSCSMVTTPYAVAGCRSGGTAVDPNCSLFSGCSEPMIWCSHNDPSYSNTNHGWPCFASQAMFDFFQSLP